MAPSPILWDFTAQTIAVSVDLIIIELPYETALDIPPSPIGLCRLSVGLWFYGTES
jgi:hypothetical protein